MKANFYSIIVSILLLFVSVQCSKKETPNRTALSEQPSEIAKNEVTPTNPIDSITITEFILKYPKWKNYQQAIIDLYKKSNNSPIWYPTKERIELAEVLYAKVNHMEEEGIKSKVPYKTILDSIYKKGSKHSSTTTEQELFTTGMFLYFIDKKYLGVDTKTIKDINWYIPKKNISYDALVDSIAKNPYKVNESKLLIDQYFRLKEALKKYSAIEKKGGWSKIELDPEKDKFQLGDSSKTIGQIRERLFVTGDLKKNSKSNIYDEELENGIQKYKKRNGFLLEKDITNKHIQEMNVPIQDRIKTIILNMERCRWISPEMSTFKERIIINIPSFKLYYIRDGKTRLESNVVVGKNTNKTVIFSGMMSYIVFSPYWNVPPSIINKEIKPGMARNKNYLAAHNMEWNNGNVRQKPGPRNSLGLVKFIFPNSNNIYLHDSPAKGLFNNETRAFSHGCIRVGRAKDLAIAITEDDPKWNSSKIEKAMNSKTETHYVLKNKIPVYIGYFTAWVNDAGEINFYKDIYKRDDKLASLLFTE